MMVQAGTAPQEVAEIVFGAIKEELFYIFPDPAVKGLIKRRMEDLIAERNPGSASR